MTSLLGPGVEYGEAFYIQCPACQGSTYEADDWVGHAYQKNKERRGCAIVVEPCGVCDGSGMSKVVLVVSPHEHQITQFEGPNVDNNFQRLFGCNECGLRYLG